MWCVYVCACVVCVFASLPDTVIYIYIYTCVHDTEKLKLMHFSKAEVKKQYCSGRDLSTHS